MTAVQVFLGNLMGLMWGLMGASGGGRREWPLCLSLSPTSDLALGHLGFPFPAW